MVSDLKKHLDIINTCFERNGMKFLSIHGNVNTTHNMVCSFAETMEEAMKHGIRKEIFDDARVMASVKAKEHNVKSKD